MPKPPIDEDSFDKINYVIDAWTTGCDAPWYIYIETMKPAAMAAFITLLTFGWDDVARGYFRPRGLYQRRRTGKRKGKWAKAKPRFPELGEEYGKRIPGATEMKGKKWSGLGKFLWRNDAVLQQVFFWWLVAEVTEDFAFEWTSLLFEGYWCQDPNVGRFSYSNDSTSPIPDKVWKLIAYGNEDYEEGPPFWGFQSGSTGGVSATIAASINVETRPPFAPPTSVRCIIRDLADQTIYADSGTNDELVNGSGAAVAKGALPPWTSFEVVAWMEGTPWANYGDGVVIGHELLE